MLGNVLVDALISINSMSIMVSKDLHMGIKIRILVKY